MFTIVVTEKGGKKQRLEFDEELIIIGRVEGTHVVLPRGNVSKQHAKLEVKSGEFRLTDLNSTNGTYVNGRKISETTVIYPSDKIYLGEFILSLEISDDATLPILQDVPISDSDSDIDLDLNVDADAKPVPVPVPELKRKVPSIKLPKPKNASIISSTHSVSKSDAAKVLNLSNTTDQKITSVISENNMSSFDSSVSTIKAQSSEFLQSSTQQPNIQANKKLNDAELLEQLLDYVAIQVKRVNRAKSPCKMDEGVAGQVRLVLRDFLNNLIAREKLPSDFRQEPILSQAFFQIVDLGPLSQWLQDKEISEIQITLKDAIKLRKNGSWIDANDVFASEKSLFNALKCLGASLPGGDESAIPGLIRFRIENGSLVLAQYPPLSLSPTAVIYKNIAGKLGHQQDLSLDLPPNIIAIIKKAISQRYRIGIAGACAPTRLSVLTDMARLLPLDKLAVSVEDLPLMGFGGPNRISLASHGLEKTSSRLFGVHALLNRAMDLNPEWIVARNVKWADFPDLLAFSATRQGLLTELPMGGINFLDKNLMAGLIAAQVSVSAKNAASLLVSSFDMIIVADSSSLGKPSVKKIIKTGLMGEEWSPKLVFER